MIDGIIVVLACIFWFILIFIVVMNLITSESHLKYASYMFKFYGISGYFSGLFWSYILPSKYFKLSLILRKEKDIHHIAFIELVCRNILNDVNGYSANFSDEYYMFTALNNGSLSFCISSMGIVTRDFDHNIILPPRTIRLIEGTKNYLDSKKSK